MPQYRIYQLDDKGQSSMPPSIGTWKNDDEAIANARTLFGGSHALAIWSGDRKVATIKPEA